MEIGKWKGRVERMVEGNGRTGRRARLCHFPSLLEIWGFGRERFCSYEFFE